MQILVAATNTADQLWPSPAEGLASTGWNWHHALMHRLGLGVFVGLVVCCPAACGSEPNSAAVAPGTVPPSPATTPSATTTNSVSATCIRSTGPTSVGGLRLTVGADAQCTNKGLTSVLVSNSTGATCTSDIVATLSDGKRLLFTSESGYGGEQGRWAPLPDSVVEGTGIIEYPPGDRRSPIDLPRLLNGTQAMSLPITCEGQAITLTATFTVGSGPRLWVQPLFASDESLGAPVKGVLQYDATNDCFLLDRDGVIYPVVWPEGTTVASSDPIVVSAAGVETRVGQFVSGGGGYLYVAEQVGIPPDCLPPSGEVAVFNTHGVVTATDAAG